MTAVRTWGAARRVSAGAVLALLFTVALLGSGATAPAAAAPCAGGSGVTVVVDFGRLGGGTRSACVPGGSGKSAVQVTSSAGFSVAFTNDGQPFVCRIGQKPAPSEESCNRTPPQDAYWGLFWSDGDPGWTYATQGATSLTVKDGWSVGWRFQDGGDLEKPSAGPHRTAAPTPRPTATLRPTPSSARPTPRPSPSPSSGGSRAPAPGAAATSQAPTAATPAGASSATPPPAAAAPSASRTAVRSTRAPTPTPPRTTATPSASAGEEPTPTTGPSDQAEGSVGTVTGGDDPGDGLGNDTGLAAVAGLAGLSALAGTAAFVAHRRGRR